MLQQEELYTQKVELLLEMHSKKMLGELAGLKQQLAGLQDELSALKRAQRQAPAAAPVSYTPAISVPTAEAAQAYAAAQANPAQAPQAAPPQNAAQAEGSPSSRPIDRNGIAPQDVSIEKIFYFGQK